MAEPASIEMLCIASMKRFDRWRKWFWKENGRKRKRATNTIASQEELGQQLLPGIPDEITVKVITPKLPWTALQTLMCVSRVWKQAYESRQVYAARVQSFATERFDVLQDYLLYLGNRLVVRSKRGGLPYVLPSIPRADNSRPEEYRIMSSDGRNWSDERFPPEYIIRSSDGKIYAVGGRYVQNLFVLDLAGQKQWKVCASMQELRRVSSLSFQCNVKDGKLHVRGGITFLEKAPWARHGRREIYDPILDSWSFTEVDVTKWSEEIWDESILDV